MRIFHNRPQWLGFMLLSIFSNAAFSAEGAVAAEYKWITFAVFGGIIALTMAITYWAAKRTHTTAEFYAANRSISGFQNGWAIAGDYLSAASFLGIAGLAKVSGLAGSAFLHTANNSHTKPSPGCAGTAGLASMAGSPCNTLLAAFTTSLG